MSRDIDLYECGRCGVVVRDHPGECPACGYDPDGVKTFYHLVEIDGGSD